MGIIYITTSFNKIVFSKSSSWLQVLELPHALEIPISQRPHPMKSLQALDNPGANYSLLQVIYGVWALQLGLQ